MADLAPGVEIPIFPLNTVLFPGGRLPLRIFEVRYVDMTKVCIRDNAAFGVCLIREGHETGTPAKPADIGCTARIVEWDVPHPGLFSLVTHGETVFHILDRWVTADGLVRARVAFEEPSPEMPLPPHALALSSFLSEVMRKVGEEHFAKPHHLEDAAWVSHRLAEVLPLSRDLKLRLLGTTDPIDKLVQIERALATMGEA